MKEFSFWDEPSLRVWALCLKILIRNHVFLALVLYGLTEWDVFGCQSEYLVFCCFSFFNSQTIFEIRTTSQIVNEIQAAKVISHPQLCGSCHDIGYFKETRSLGDFSLFFYIYIFYYFLFPQTLNINVLVMNYFTCTCTKAIENIFRWCEQTGALIQILKAYSLKIVIVYFPFKFSNTWFFFFFF